MDFDLEYDYEEALKRQNIDPADIEILRKTVAEIEVIPKTLTDKQVWVILSIIINFKVDLIIYSIKIP